MRMAGAGKKTLAKGGGHVGARILLFVLCAAGFAALLWQIHWVHDNKALPFDTAIIDFFQRHVISDTLTPTVKTVTTFGGVAAVVAVTATLLVVSIIAKRARIGVSLAACVALAAGLNEIIKYWVRRPRPVDHRIIPETGYSFPSGHSMNNMAFYGFLIVLVFWFVQRKWLRWLIAAVLAAVVVAIGLSRIYLGVHYPSDVLAGWLFAIAYVDLYAAVVKRWVVR